MMTTQIHRTFLVCLLSLFSLSVLAEQIDNSEYKSWAQFKPGSLLKTKFTTNNNGNISESETTDTLLEVLPDKVIVESKSVTIVSGQRNDVPARKKQIAAKTPAPRSRPNAQVTVKESEETIKVLGKSYKCKVRETTTKYPAGTSTNTQWLCDQVPGGTAKSTTSSVGTFNTTSSIEILEMTIEK